MEEKENKSINNCIRSLHRDIGFFVIGLTIIYSISGIILTYRDTNFLKYETLVEKTLSPNMEASELGKVLHLRDFKFLKNEGEIEYFQNGTYNKSTGFVKYSKKELPPILNKLTNLHKASSRNLKHLFSTIFGILLLFLAISSFWMFKTKTKLFRRGICIAGLGVVFAIILLVL
jgi:hypothetical protein